MNAKEFGKLVKEHRKQLNLELRELAYTIEIVTPGYVSEVESGKKIPSPEVFKKLSEVLKFSDEEISTWKDFLAKEYSRKEALKEAHKKEYEAKVLSTEALKANLKYNLKYINTYLDSLAFKKLAGEEINLEELEDLKAKAADALSLYGSVFNSIYRNISNENSKHELQITAAYISACAESLLKESSLE